MSEIFREVDEELREEQLLRLWHKYGKLLIAAAVAIVLGVAGTALWRNYTHNRQETDSDRFAAALDLVNAGKMQEAIGAFAKLAKDGTTGYGALARLREAATRLKAGDRDGAVAAYDALASDGDAPRLLRDFAALQAAWQLADSASADEVGIRLGQLIAPENPWRFSALELQAAVLLKAGDRAGALEIYKGLVTNPQGPLGVRRRAGDMVDALEPTPAEKAAPEAKKQEKQGE